MTALALLGIAPDSLEDRLEAARAAQSWPAVAIAIGVAILLFWLVSRLGDDDAALEAAGPEASPEPEPAVRVSSPSAPTYSGVRVAFSPQVDDSKAPRAA